MDVSMYPQFWDFYSITVVSYLHFSFHIVCIIHWEILFYHCCVIPTFFFSNRLRLTFLLGSGSFIMAILQLSELKTVSFNSDQTFPIFYPNPFCNMYGVRLTHVSSPELTLFYHLTILASFEDY